MMMFASVIRTLAWQLGSDGSQTLRVWNVAGLGSGLSSKGYSRGGTTNKFQSIYRHISNYRKHPPEPCSNYEGIYITVRRFWGFRRFRVSGFG